MRLVALLCALASSGCGPAYAFSLFEADSEGFTVFGNADTTIPTYLATGGNPGGHICTTDVAPEFFYFVAPPKYLGNASRVYGTKLTFDMKTSAQFELLRGGRDVVLTGGGLGLANSLSTFPGQDWTAFTLRLDANNSGWRLDATGEAVTEEQFRTVLSNLTSIRVRGDFVSRTQDVTCLDNVYFGAL